VSERVANRRIRLLLVVAVLVFAGTLARAVWLQGVQAGTLERMATRQHREPIVIPATRGTITDRNGEPLAIGEQATTVYADPRRIRNPRRVAAIAARELGVDPNGIYERIADRTKGFVYVLRKADPAKARSLQRRGLAGLGFYAEEQRAYPQRTVAAHVLGFAGIDNHGLDGLERSLDRLLAGRPGSETVVKDPFGRVLDVVDTRAERPGHDVQLTIDHQIQANAEAVLAQTVRQWHAKAASAIVLDPRTGAVLAMAVAPGFDANRFGAASAGRRRNRAVTDMYEPGSTFKLVTVAAALSEGLATPLTAFTLPPSIQVADRVIHEHDPRPTERMTVARILAESSNVGTVTIAKDLLGPDRLARWIGRFGFGKPTGIDFPGESAGAALPRELWSGSTIGTVPIGQGIAVTPIQMASVYAAIGNGGVLMRPHLVDRIDGVRRSYRRGRRVVSRTVAAQVMTMLRGVVDAGTGTGAAVPGYTVAGKTGTANKPEGGSYSTSKYVASFVGLVPAKKPRLAIMVMVDEPKGAIWGGVVAAPAFQEIARFDLQYLEVSPDAPLPG
jgi:cell division protein FtsI (penicillin-binding protein 3)/stage V sporulation protein D (sporulation-specific penicillin-binding protein)